MKTVFTSLLFFLLAGTLLNAKTYYVKRGGAGDGSSWTQSTGDLAGVLEKAKAGDEIWVAAGVYIPTKSNDRTKSFVLTEGIKVYGGFIGNEHSRDQRDWENNATLLSGEIGDEVISDNCFNVIYAKNVSMETVLDGFTITRGNADNKNAPKADRSKSGAGFYNDGSNGGSSSPIIRNCLFIGNSANDGAAFFNNARNNGNCKPVFVNCQFVKNLANMDGGAFHSDTYGKGKCELIFRNCLLKDNAATYGAGIFAEVGDGYFKIALSNCTLDGNAAQLYGGALYMNGQDYDLEIESCQFRDNYPSDINKNYFFRN